jgi:hypothetical protein
LPKSARIHIVIGLTTPLNAPKIIYGSPDSDASPLAPWIGWNWYFVAKSQDEGSLSSLRHTEVGGIQPLDRHHGGVAAQSQPVHERHEQSLMLWLQ